jgi:hypothetical protein
MTHFSIQVNSFLPANCRNVCNQISHYLSVYMGIIYYVILQDTAECNYIYQAGKPVIISSVFS